MQLRGEFGRCRCGREKQWHCKAAAPNKAEEAVEKLKGPQPCSEFRLDPKAQGTVRGSWATISKFCHSAVGSLCFVEWANRMNDIPNCSFPSANVEDSPGRLNRANIGKFRESSSVPSQK